MATEARKVNELVDKQVPYSEMTEDEIASVVDYWAAVKARDEVYQKTLEEIQSTQLACAEAHRLAAESKRKDLHDMIDRILNEVK